MEKAFLIYNKKVEEDSFPNVQLNGLSVSRIRKFHFQNSNAK